ncbi:hypothetical protein ACRAWC_18605 [Leifsonia sp. L25]|uniref:hypothetical protein n=1 Tax=Actinomycetes TaxID=1760 RepID=UPI003D683436
MSKVPAGYKLAATTDRHILESDEYMHWTVADLMEMLAEFPPEARLWVMDHEETVHPVEGFGGDKSDLFIH